MKARLSGMHLEVSVPQVEAALKTILTNQGIIMATQAQEAQRVEALLAIAGGIATKVDGALTEIATLKEIIAAQPNADPALTAGLDALETKLKSVDTQLATIGG